MASKTVQEGMGWHQDGRILMVREQRRVFVPLPAYFR
jgi:hypothetical protein